MLCKVIATPRGLAEDVVGWIGLVVKKQSSEERHSVGLEEDMCWKCKAMLCLASANLRKSNNALLRRFRYTALQQ